MMKPRSKKIQPDEPVELLLTERQRHLILEHTLAEPDLTKKLEIAETRGERIAGMYTLDDLDHLSEWVAAAANHCEDPRLRKQLDHLFGLIRTTLESYDDGQWPNPL